MQSPPTYKSSSSKRHRSSSDLTRGPRLVTGSQQICDQYVQGRVPMIRLTPEEIERRRRAKIGRIVMGVSALLLMIMSAVLPNVMVQAATILPGRSLIPASHFFLIANPNAEAFSGAKS